MADILEIARVRLPAGVQADDVLSLFDQMAHRVAAVVRPAGARRKLAGDGGEPVALPADLKPLAKLPEHLAGPWDRFTTGVQALATLRGARDRIAADPAADGGASFRAESNDACDGSFRSFATWLEGWTLARDDGQKPTPADAQWLHGAVFAEPEGLRFINFRPRRQWMAMKPRMEILASPRAEEVVSGLGGARQYRQLVEAHAQFGHAFGFLSVVADVESAASDVRPEFLAAKDALRDLVRKLDSYAEPTVAGSEALSAFLIKPYLDLVAELAQAAPRAAKKPASPAIPPPASAGDA